MNQPTIAQIHRELAEAMDIVLPTSWWDRPYEDIVYDRRMFDPFTNPADLEALEAWAWDTHHWHIWPGIGDNIVSVEVLTMDCDPLAKSQVPHDDTGMGRLRAKREAICRAIYHAITNQEATDEH